MGSSNLGNAGAAALAGAAGAAGFFAAQLLHFPSSCLIVIETGSLSQPQPAAAALGLASSMGPSPAGENTREPEMTLVLLF